MDCVGEEISNCASVRVTIAICSDGQNNMASDEELAAALNTLVRKLTMNHYHLTLIWVTRGEYWAQNLAEYCAGLMLCFPNLEVYTVDYSVFLHCFPRVPVQEYGQRAKLFGLAKALRSLDPNRDLMYQQVKSVFDTVLQTLWSTTTRQTERQLQFLACTIGSAPFCSPNTVAHWSSTSSSTKSPKWQLAAITGSARDEGLILQPNKRMGYL